MSRNMVRSTEAKTATFWTEKYQMGLDPDTVQGLVSEDVASPMDLSEFKKEHTQMLASNLRKPKGRMTLYLGQEQADQGKAAPKPGSRFGTKS